MDETVTIPDVEILRVGTWNGVPFSLEDLHGIADAFGELEGERPPRVQLGHDAKQRLAIELFGPDGVGADGFPVLGWPKRLRVKGDVLLADLVDVPVKLAGWIRQKKWTARSGGLLRNYKSLAGKVYAWALDHVALLGDQSPAVPGLADMGLSADGAVFTFAYEAADGVALATPGDGKSEPEEETTLDRILTELESLAEQWGALVYGRRGAPAARTLWTEFASRLRTVARENMEDRMIDKSKLELAGMTFDSAEQLVGWLAGALGVAPGDFGAIADAVAKALGTAVPDAAPADPAADPAATPGGDAAMASKDNDMIRLAAEKRLADMDARLADTQARLAASELAAARAAAERRVDTDMASRAIPAALRETLVELAMRPDLAPYQSVIDNAKTVPTGERGHAADGTNLAAVTLTATDRLLARQNNLTEEQFLAQKTADHAARVAATA